MTVKNINILCKTEDIKHSDMVPIFWPWEYLMKVIPETHRAY